jgi:hypothetical protein
MVTIHVKAYNVSNDIVELLGKAAPFAVEAAAAGTELVDEMCLHILFARDPTEPNPRVEIGYEAHDDSERSHKVGTVTSFAFATLFDRLTAGHKDRKAAYVQRAKKAASARWASKAANGEAN